MAEETSKNRSLPLFVVLFLLSLGLNAYLFFKYAKNGEQIKKQNEELAIAYQAANLKADSLQNELDFTIQQLQDKINENLAQADLKESIRQQLEGKKAELARTKRQLSQLIATVSGANGGNEGPASLAEAKVKLNQLKEENETYIKQAELAQKEYEQAKEELRYTQGKAKQYRIENDSLIEITTELNQKLETASTMRIAGFRISPIRDKRGVEELTEKASKTEKFKIDFSILASQLTKKDEKDIIIRIINPNGVVLSKDTDKLMDKEDVTSLEHTLTYEGEEKGVTYYYDQEEEYESGAYKAELYNNGKLVGRTSFSLR